MVPTAVSSAFATTSLVKVTSCAGDAEPSIGMTAPQSGASVCARDRLCRASAAPDEDPVTQADVDTRRRELVGAAVDGERELPDRIGPVRDDALDRPCRALDGDRPIRRLHDDAVQGRADRPAIDHRRELEITVRTHVDDPAVERRAQGTREPAPGARDDRAALELRTRWHAHHLREVDRRDAETARAQKTNGLAKRRPIGHDLAGADPLTDGGTLRRAERQGLPYTLIGEAPTHLNRSLSLARRTRRRSRSSLDFLIPVPRTRAR